MHHGYVELIGINDINKGAELMLHAVARQQDEHLRGWTVAVAPDAASYETRCRAGVRQRVFFDRLGPLGSAAGNLLPRRVREPLGLVAESEISAVLDASGFAYSDQQSTERFATRVAGFRRWRAQGKRIVLLPQAFGPFATRETQELAGQLLDCADLAFPRDDESARSLAELRPARHLTQAPDFTNLVHVEPARRQREDYEGRACVVPNFRMVDRASPQDADAYRSLLVAVVGHLEHLGTRPFALIVNAKKDASLIAALQDELGHDVETVEPADALDVKRIIGLCHVVVASRYHALVSSLAQGVPALALGWSHKYPALMADYGADELLFDVGRTEPVLAALATLVRPEERARVSEGLRRHAADLEAASHDMWRAVADCLGG